VRGVRCRTSRLSSRSSNLRRVLSGILFPRFGEAMHPPCFVQMGIASIYSNPIRCVTGGQVLCLSARLLPDSRIIDRVREVGPIV
jgi:hypothetical protein